MSINPARTFSSTLSGWVGRARGLTLWLISGMLLAVQVRKRLMRALMERAQNFTMMSTRSAYSAGANRRNRLAAPGK